MERRINKKYGGLHFHPLWLFYMGGMILFLIGIIYSLNIFLVRVFLGELASIGTILMAVLFVITGLQSLFFALFFDMETNKHLLS